jgi:putative ABC transport system permease protein
MIRVAFKSVLARWPRAMATSLAVVVGVGVVSGTLMVSDTAEVLGINHDGLDIIRTVLPVAGGVALLVGAFIVNLTMAVTVAHRTQELALLRCVGAQVRQVRRLVVLESLAIGVVAALMGLLAGVGVAAGLRRLINTDVFPGDLPGTELVVTSRTVLAALLLGAIVTTVSGWAVARRAGRIAPLAALRDAASGGPDRPGRTRVVLGAIAALLTVVAVGLAVAAGRGQLLLPAAALALTAVRLLGPLVAPVVAAIVIRPAARLGRLPSELGARNATRHPYRFAAVASAVLVGVALMSFVTVVLASVRGAMVSELARYQADFELRASAEGAGLSPDLVAGLRQRPELASVVTESCTPDAVVASDELVCTIDPARLGDAFALEVVDGRLSDVATGGIAVNAIQARAEGWRVGSPVTVRLPGGSHVFPVAAIYRSFYYLGAPIIAPDEYARLGGDGAAATVFVRVADGTDPAAARAAIDRVVAGALPGVEIRSRAQVRAAPLEQIDAAAWVYRTLTGLAVLVGLFGIINVLALSLVERSRELMLLRAVGLGRGQVRAMVRAEATVIAGVGVGAGVGLGVLFGWATARVLEHGSQPIVFDLPAAPLAVIAGSALLAALIAAALPAAWAGRLPLLRG